MEQGVAAHASRMIVGVQISAALGILQWSAVELAEKAGVSLSTVKRAEAAALNVPGITAPNLARIERTLEDAGVIFITEGQQSLTGAVGVRLGNR